MSTLILVLSDYLIGRAIAAFLLLWFLPGWVCLEAFSSPVTEVIWRTILACGLGFALTSLSLLYLTYLNIPLAKWHPITISAAVTLPAWILTHRRKLSPLSWPLTRMGCVLIGVFVVAAAVRFIQLGYAEFHEDEVEVLNLAVRAGKGEGYAVFLHRKGPLQMLAPLAFWLLTGHINEGLARLPFATASLLGVLTVAYLAFKVGNSKSGLIAGLLVAVNGYLVAFGRMVQYQSLVFWLVSLVVLCLWEVRRSGERTLLVPAALCMGTSLLAHFDAAVYLPVIGYLVWQIEKRWPAVRYRLWISALIIAGALLSFYVPYALDAQFPHTFNYLFENRVGTQWFYNNLATVGSLDRVYASRYHLPLLLILTAALFAIRLLRQKQAKWPAGLSLTVGGIATVIAIWWPDLYRFGDVSLAVLPWLLLTGGAFWSVHGAVDLASDMPRSEDNFYITGLEIFVLWWTVPALAYTFLVRSPGTHVYVMYPGLAVLAGLGALSVWRWVARSVRMFFIVAGFAWLSLVLGYQSVIFLSSESLWTDVYAGWKNSWGSIIYGALPRPASYFGYPRHMGWKGAGYLMDRGAIPDDFRSIGVEFSVPVWYMFDTPRSCYSDAMLYLVALPADAGEDYVPKKFSSASDYTHIATIYAEGRPRLSLWQRGMMSERTPVIYELEELSPRFDEIATLERFSALRGDMVRTDYRFATVAKLIGYRVQPRPVAEVIRASPGDMLMLWLYWQSIQPSEGVYRAFVHLGENPVWAQQDDDPACRLPTSLWRAGQVATGQFRLIIPHKMPSGRYPLNLGLYDPVTMERLSVVGEHGQELGDAISLATVEVQSCFQ
ncbi:MAG: ArnT family glycosyltransferase [Anaerolineae bacterium]